MPPEAQRVLLTRFQHLKPPDYQRLSKAERSAVRHGGLCSVTGKWLADRAFFEWIEQNRHELDHADGGGA